jgi:hypothetical protein
MRRIVFYILLLSPVYAVDLPQQEVCMDKSGWVYVITRDLSTLVTYPDGGWECKSSIMKYDQQTYLKMLYQNADKGNWMRKLAMLSRYWVYKPTPWEAMGITKDQYDDWVATGILKTQAELDALKQAKADAQQQQIAAATAEISAIKYYINPGTGVWHTDPNCVDNVNTIVVSPFDIMSYPNQKRCEKCGAM